MQKNRIFIWFIFVLTLLSGCRRDGGDALVVREPGGLIRVNADLLAAMTEPVGGFDLTAHFTPVGVMHTGDEPETFISGGVHGWYVCDEESVLAYGYPRVLRLSLKDGSLLNEYGRKGRGPGEFLDAESCFVRDGKVYVSDEMSRVHVYDVADGQLLEEFPLTDTQVQLCMLSPLEQDYFLLGYSSIAGKNQRFDVLDKHRLPVRASSLHFDWKAIEKEKSIWTGNAGPFDDQTCIFSGDTLYRVTPKKEIPVLTVSSTSHKEDAFVSSSVKMGDLLFMDYRFPDQYIRTVLDIKRGKPVFFAPGHRESREVRTPDGRTVTVKVMRNAEEWGLPLMWEGEEHRVWPVFADRGLLICRDNKDGSCFFSLKRK